MEQVQLAQQDSPKQEEVKEELKVVQEVETSAGETETPGEEEKKGKVVKKAGKRIGYNYIILKSLKESQKNDVVKCLYIKGLFKWGICVIKEGTYGDTKDKEGRDIKDRLIWQKQLHEQLQDKVRLPRYLGSFEENGNYYLVIERIKGKSLYKVCRDKSNEIREGLISGNKTGIKFIDYIIQIINILDALHQNKVIHRDASSNNFIITPSGKVAVIDMELSYSFGQQLPSPPFQLGTQGFMSPQQESLQVPSVKDDVFALGAIIIQVWTGISPIKFIKTPIETLLNKIYFFIPDKELAESVIKCLQPNPAERPLLTEVKKVVESYKQGLLLKNNRVQSKAVVYTNNQIREIIQVSINTLSSPLLSDPEKGWFSEDKSKPNLDPGHRKINRGWYTSFNKGVAGIIYTLSRAKQAGFDISSNSPSLQKALELIKGKYINRITRVSPSLHFGSSGIAASLCIALQNNVLDPEMIYFDWIGQLISVESRTNKLKNNLSYIDGIAGQGLANLYCYPFINNEYIQKRLESYVYDLLERQSDNGSWATGKKGKITKGFARGVAGIIYFLLEYATYNQKMEVMMAAKKGLEWLMKTSVKRKRVIQWRSSAQKDLAPWWREGAPGIAMAFMKAYSLFGKTDYKEYATGALLTNPKNLVTNNLGQAQGLSGLGELYLEAYNTLQDPTWLERAGWIAQVLLHLAKEHKEYGYYWLTGHEREPVSDFMNGNSGIIHFLIRYCHREIPFPLAGK